MEDFFKVVLFSTMTYQHFWPLIKQKCSSPWQWTKRSNGLLFLGVRNVWRIIFHSFDIRLLIFFKSPYHILTGQKTFANFKLRSLYRLSHSAPYFSITRKMFLLHWEIGYIFLPICFLSLVAFYFISLTTQGNLSCFLKSQT